MGAEEIRIYYLRGGGRHFVAHARLSNSSLLLLVEIVEQGGGGTNL